MKPLTRSQAIKILCQVTDRDDPYWEMLVIDFYDEKDDSIPSLYDVLNAIGVTDEEYAEGEGISDIMILKGHRHE